MIDRATRVNHAPLAAAPLSPTLVINKTAEMVEMVDVLFSISFCFYGAF